MRKILVLVFMLLSISLYAIDINKASESEFANIKGIGAKKAQDIIKYRNKVGKFKNYDDLLNVKGIGTKTLYNIKNDVKNANKDKKSSKSKKSSKDKKNIKENKNKIKNTNKKVDKTTLQKNNKYTKENKNKTSKTKKDKIKTNSDKVKN